MKLKMTIDEALAFADEWSIGMTVHEGSQGWRVVCMLLANEVRSLRVEKALAVPVGMVLLSEDMVCANGDSQYIAGAKFGWNCAVDGNEALFKSAIEGRTKERAMLAAAQKDGE